MGEALPEGVTRQEFSELAGAVKEVREALDELRQARTEPERREARAEVRDAKADLAATARELGLDPKRLEAAAAEARTKDEKERLRPLLIELLDEELAEGAEEAAGAVEGAAEAAAGAAGQAAGAAAEKGGEAAEAAPKPDSGPTMTHWSERPLSALFGGGGSDG